MKRTKKNRRSTNQASKKATTPVESRRSAALWLRAVPLLVVALLAFGVAPSVEAAVVPIGGTPVDTTISKDGSMSFVLDSTSATLTEVDPATDQIVQVIPLWVPPGTALSCDWNDNRQQVVVGCTNGQVLWADASTGTSGVMTNNPAGNYGVSCAGHVLAFTDGWAIDQASGTLHQLFSNGTWMAVAFSTTVTPAEIVEKQVDPALAGGFDNYLVAAGTNGMGQTVVEGFDRGSMLMLGTTTWLAAPRTATGITTSRQSDIFVSTQAPGGGAGDVLHCALPITAFTPTPLVSYGTGAPTDVSCAGNFLTILETMNPGPGAIYHFHDVADAANVLHIGDAWVDPGAIGATGLDTWVPIDETPSLDVLYAIHGDAAGIAISIDGEEIRIILMGAIPSSVLAWLYNLQTTALANYNSETMIGCGGCAPDEVVGRGPLEGALINPGTGQNVEYATGEEVFTLPVLSVPGVGLDLDIWLTYRSRRDFDYRYGQSWNLNQDVRLETKPNSDLVYHNGYGRLDTYTYQVGGTYIPPPRYDTTLVAGGATTITNRIGTTSTFDSSGRRTQVQDRYGNTITYTWTGDQLTRITDTLSRVYTLAYGATGRLSSVTDFGGRVWSITYDYLGQLRTVTTPASTQFTTGRTFWFAYSGNHATAALRSNLTHVWSAAGDLVQTFVYDSNDMIRKEFIGDGSFEMSYSTVNRKTTVVDRSGNTTDWTFNTAGAPTQREVFTKGLRTPEPVSYITTYSVNATTGMVDYAVFPRGNRVDYTYDTNLNLTELRRRETNTSTNWATDIVHTYGYGVYGQRNSYRDPLGITTAYTLDALGNTTQVLHPPITNPAVQIITENCGYDAAGRITSATDGEGRQVTFSYYTTGIQTGYLQSIVRDPTPGLNLTTTFCYDQYGNVISIQDPRGNTTTITVDAEDYVTEIQAPSTLNYRRRVTYDANRSVTKIEVENLDRKGVQDTATPWIETNLTYDILGRLIEREVDLTSTTVATTKYEYDGSGSLIKITHPELNVDEFTWDERHLLFEATRGVGDPEETTSSFDYDENANLVTATDGRSNATTFEYDLFDRRERAINALSHFVLYGYDKNSNRTLVEAHDGATGPEARSTHYFDAVNRRWKVVQDRFGPGLTASYPTTTFTRDRGHLLTQVKDPLNNTTTFAHDTAGRRTTATDAFRNYQSYTLDANGNVTVLSDTQVPATGPGETFVTEFDYDVLNRITERREIDRLNALNILTTTYEYDSRSNLTFRTDAEGNPVRWTYDLASRLTKYERALQVGVTIDTFLQSIDEVFVYDRNHRLTMLTDDNFNSTTYTYDALSRRTRTTYADTKYIDYGYDLASNLSGWTDQNGTVVANTHDAVNRLTARSVTRGTGVLGTTAETYTYDALNRMLTAVDDDFQVDFQYDSVGNLLQDNQGYTTIGNERWQSVTTGYTDAGSVSGIAYPSAFQVSHTRDSIYRMTAMVDASGPTNIATFTWQGASRLATTSNQNGTGTDYVYDGFRNVGSIDHTLSGGGSLHKFEYAYDNVHNRRMEKNTFNATWIMTLPAAVQTFLNGRNNKGDVYAYDMAYRLVDARYDVTNPLTEVQNPGTQAFVTNIAYTIDGLGNRSQVSTTPPTPPTQVLYANDVVNQYTTVGGTARTHDNNGNLSDDGTYKFGYDFENRLVELRNSTTSALIASYRYDALGRRVEKSVVGGATTRYVLDGVQVVEEFDGSNIWQARYVYEDGIDQPRCMDRADIADVNGNSNTTEVLRFHYHQQALGSVTELTQPTGAVVEWVTYDVYGLPTIRNQVGTSVTQSAVGNPWLYTGREYDPESGLFFYRARTYDPGTGRFLQRDPLGFVDGLNARSYTQESPSSGRDPLGLETLRIEYAKGSSPADTKTSVADAIDAHNAKAAPENQISETEKTKLVNLMGEPITDEDGKPELDAHGNQLYVTGYTKVYWAYEIRDEHRPEFCGGWGHTRTARFKIARTILIYSSQGELHHELGHLLDAEALEEEFERRFTEPHAEHGAGGNEAGMTEKDKKKARSGKAARDLESEMDRAEDALHDAKGLGGHDASAETRARLREIEREERQRAGPAGGAR